MARRTGLISALMQANREIQRQQAAQERAAARAVRASIQAQRAYERAQIADQKERARLHVESRMAEVDSKNDQLGRGIKRLTNLLNETLSVDDYFDLEKLKQEFEKPPFNPGKLSVAETTPSLQAYLPPNLSLFWKLWPGAKVRHAETIAMARSRYEQDVAAHHKREAARQRDLADARSKYESQMAEIQE